VNPIRAVWLPILLLTWACGSGSAPGELHVFAATSLTDAFTELGEQLEADVDGLGVVLNLAGSSDLVRQIRGGAAADVIATADETNMAVLVDAGLIDAPATFTRNRLAIVVPRDNAKRVRTLGDLARDDVTVVLCAEQVACGRYADEALRKAGVEVTAASREENVRAVLTKVRLGEADAGVVYVTDVQTAPAVESVPIPAEHNVVARYQIAVVRGAANAAAASAFVALVRSGAGQRVLRSHGFGAS
jgi:molybdate transport system substrate-binding protein